MRRYGGTFLSPNDLWLNSLKNVNGLFKIIHISYIYICERILQAPWWEPAPPHQPGEGSPVILHQRALSSCFTLSSGLYPCISFNLHVCCVIVFMLQLRPQSWIRALLCDAGTQVQISVRAKTVPSNDRDCGIPCPSGRSDFMLGDKA